jgi:UDPglucose 6-dehydrogenase
LTEVAQYWESVVQMNDYQKRRFVQNMIRVMFNTIAGKKIALFGFAFKADTGDTRESPAIDVARQLVEERAQVVITDPEALGNAAIDLGSCGSAVKYSNDPYDAASGAHAIAIMTEWKLYKELDYKRIYESMEKPAFIFDGRNILDHQKLYDIGFNVFPLGTSALKHF